MAPLPAEQTHGPQAAACRGICVAPGSAPTQFVQPVVVDAEVMGDLVDHRDRDLLDDLSSSLADLEQRVAVDRDGVGQRPRRTTSRARSTPCPDTGRAGRVPRDCGPRRGRRRCRSPPRARVESGRVRRTPARQTVAGSSARPRGYCPGGGAGGGSAAAAPAGAGIGRRAPAPGGAPGPCGGAPAPAAAGPSCGAPGGGGGALRNVLPRGGGVGAVPPRSARSGRRRGRSMLAGHVLGLLARVGLWAPLDGDSRGRVRHLRLDRLGSAAGSAGPRGCPAAAPAADR